MYITYQKYMKLHKHKNRLFIVIESETSLQGGLFVRRLVGFTSVLLSENLLLIQLRKWERTNPLVQRTVQLYSGYNVQQWQQQVQLVK